MLFIVQKVAIHSSDTMTAVTIFTNLLNEVCDDVEVELSLQNFPDATVANRSTTTDDDARLYIKTNDFFNAGRNFFDAKVFHQFAKSWKQTEFLQKSQAHQEAEIRAKDDQS